MEGRRHGEILSQARQHLITPDHAKALETVEPILDSQYVGPAARLLKDEILDNLRQRVSECTRRIEADPREASAYSERARHYDCLHDRTKARADMARWSAIKRQHVFWDSWFGAASELTHVIDGPSGYQLVFSAARLANKTPELSIAFGQKGRWEMRVFEIPVWMTSLLGLCLLSGLDSPPAYAGFTFGKPVNLEVILPVLDPAHDGPDCLSYDGLEMYIESDGPGGYGGYDLWVLKRQSTQDNWGPPENLGLGVNSSNSDGAASISADGLTLYFSSNRPGGYGDSDTWMTTRAAKNAPWGPPVNLGPNVNSSAQDGSPWVSSDGLELYFHSSRSGGYGSSDLYVARRATPSDRWGQAVNLGPVVNNPYGECQPSLSPDGLVLFFHDVPGHARPGGYGAEDIWMTRRASRADAWQTPVNLGPH